ncbi:serine/threonine-protein kinase [uncultured Mobiluncus sp.]|uniref:serine/threonine-protein kinase n=1 Tax=uncultured Mobiluncus sp. TaxID=293425 RepID=UPI0025E758CB|nr:serine/threonine-protein kinase [uncultured Mobiluncus sp.]
MIGANTVLNDRYRLVSILATGGMGVIWRGWDKRSQNVVAVKVLKEELIGQATFLARLRAEATNAARLHHPNLAAVFDWGETDGQGWIVMELVEGRPLSDILAGGQVLTWEQLAPILIQIANGLQASHEGHVIHRDVKPSNILVSDKGVAKLTDFGISLAPRAEALTAAGMVMGTAQYLPPEQAMGETATALGDIYALGVIAYEALAGKRPFTGPTQVDIAMSHVKDPVPPLPETVNSQVAALIYQMLEKDPRLRPQSAKQLAEAIQALWHGTVPLSFTPRMSFSRNLADAPPTAQMPVAPVEDTPKDASSESPSAATPATAAPVDPAPQSPHAASAKPDATASAAGLHQAGSTPPASPTPETSAPPLRPDFHRVKPAQPAAIPVGSQAIPPQRHEEMMRYLEAKPLPQPESGSKRKLVIALVITAVVLIALIFGLATTLRTGASTGNLESGLTVTSVAAPASSPVEEENLESV